MPPSESTPLIPFLNLAIMLVPVVLVIGVLYAWRLKAGEAVYAISRMLMQLVLIGYLLTHIFDAHYSVLIGLILLMVTIASWIALRTAKEWRLKLYPEVFLSIAVGGGLTLLLVMLGVLDLEPWYKARKMIPLAGMIFGNAMNSISLAADRYFAERNRDATYQEARNIAYQAALIPITNSLFVVGLVSIPGLMTGQILSGVSPLVAVRYQIMVMCMVFSSAGLSSACFLVLAKRKLETS